MIPYFGDFGGQFVPETLMPVLAKLEKAYQVLKNDKGFMREYERLMTTFAGRPTPLHPAQRLTEELGGARIYLKREDLAHLGAHKINNALGQVLLAKYMGKSRVIAETGAGQHGVATAAAAAALGLECVVYMGRVDRVRQRINVQRMELFGAEVREVDTGPGTLKDAINEAMRDLVTNCENTHYVIGSAVGPHPYPYIVREFQRVIGLEAREQVLAATGRLPDHLVACVGGGSNAIGLFHPFLDTEAAMTGVEGGGTGERMSSASLSEGEPGILHGTRSYILQDEDGQITPAHSISAGLDYPGVGPEHAYLKSTGRVRYVSALDNEAVDAMLLLSRLEGIIPALESSHALAFVTKLAPTLNPDDIIIVGLSGRGDKDLGILEEREMATAGSAGVAV